MVVGPPDLLNPSPRPPPHPPNNTPKQRPSAPWRPERDGGRCLNTRRTPTPPLLTNQRRPISKNRLISRREIVPPRATRERRANHGDENRQSSGQAVWIWACLEASFSGLHFPEPNGTSSPESPLHSIPSRLPYPYPLLVVRHIIPGPVFTIIIAKADGRPWRDNLGPHIEKSFVRSAGMDDAILACELPFPMFR